MKKALTIIVLLSTLVLSACSTYTCPTYSKAPVKQNANRW